MTLTLEESTEAIATALGTLAADTADAFAGDSGPLLNILGVIEHTLTESLWSCNPGTLGGYVSLMALGGGGGGVGGVDLTDVIEQLGNIDSNLWLFNSNFQTLSTYLLGDFRENLSSLATHSRGQTEAQQALVSLLAGGTATGGNRILGLPTDADKNAAQQLGACFAGGEWQQTMDLLSNKANSPGLLDTYATELKSAASSVGKFFLDLFDTTVAGAAFGQYRVASEARNVKPGDALGHVGQALISAMAAGGAAHYLSGIMAKLYKGSGGFRFANLSSFIADMAGFKEISSCVMGPLYGGFLKTPWTYQCNANLRPEIPRLQDLFTMAHKGMMSVADMTHNWAPFHGYTKDWIDKLYKIHLRDPGLRELRVILPTSNLTKQQIVDLVKQLGYDPGWHWALADGLWESQTDREKQARLNTLMQRVVAGDMTWTLYVKYVDELVPNVRRRAFVLADAESRRAIKQNQQGIDLAKDMFARDQLTETDFLNTLKAIIPVKDQVEYVYNEALSRRYKSVPKLAWRDVEQQRVSAAKALYVAGRWPTAKLLLTLVSSGIDPQAAQTIIEALDRQKAVKVPKALRIKAVKALKVPLKPEELEALGLSPEEVAADTAELTLNQVQQAYIQELITERDFTTAMTEFGYNQADAAILLALTNAQKRRFIADRPAASDLGAYKSAYVASLLSGDELDAALEDSGLTAAQIAVEHLTLDAKREAANAA